MDAFILLSVVNTKLRDKYSSLEEYCQEEDKNRVEIEALLKSIGYVYDADANSFKNIL